MEIRSIHNLTLSDVLDKYVESGSTFSFVNATDEKNQHLLALIQNYYHSRHVSASNDTAELFNNLTVIDNIYIENIFTFGKRKQKQIEHCQTLLDWLNFKIDPMTLVKDLSEEEKRIVELLKLYECGCEIVILRNITSFLGYHYYEIFMELVHLFQCRGTTVILLTIHWEDTLKFSRFIAVMTGEKLFSVMPVEDVTRDPRKIIFALAGDMRNTCETMGHNSIDVLSTVFKGSELFVKNKEFTNALRFLASSAMDALSAQSCVIYFESDDGKIFHFSDQEKTSEHFLLKDNYVSNVINGTDPIVFLSKRSCDFSDLFCVSSENTCILFGLPITAIPQKIGFLAVTYNYYFIYSEEQLTLLKTFVHEVSRIIQTSQMVNHSILLQESYHRIKNNLQMIVSLIYMQKTYLLQQLELNDTQIQLAFDDIIGRIKSIAFVHELMAGDSLGSNIINLKYVAEKIAGIYKNSTIKMTMDIDTIGIPCNKAVSIAMMINELLCNCCRHAFSDSSIQNCIYLCIKNRNNIIYINVKDNGIGIPDPDDFLTAASVGATIIRNIVRELKASITISCECGTAVNIAIPKTININDMNIKIKQPNNYDTHHNSEGDLIYEK